MKGQVEGVTMAKEYIVSFVGVFVAVLVVASFITPILDTFANISGVPVLTQATIGGLLGAGIILFLMKALF